MPTLVSSSKTMMRRCLVSDDRPLWCALMERLSMHREERRARLLNPVRPTRQEAQDGIEIRISRVVSSVSTRALSPPLTPLPKTAPHDFGGKR